MSYFLGGLHVIEHMIGANEGLGLCQPAPTQDTLETFEKGEH